jgi:four helix bundle protein
MNNIAEGFGRFSNKDSIRFYDISQSSAMEVLSICYVLSDLDYLPNERIVAIREKAEETKNLTLAFIKSIRIKLETSTP